MAIEFVCPACQGSLRVADDAAGRIVRCGSCLATLRVPGEAMDEGPVESAPAVPRPVETVAPPRSTSREDRDERDEEDYGEPRPTRRRPAAKKSTGRGVLFWLVIIAMTFCLLTCLACGGIMLVFATPHWRTHESAAGGYKVDFPADLNPYISEQAKRRQKANEVVEGTMLVGRLETFWVAYVDLDPQMRRKPADELLKQAVQALANDTPGSSIDRETPKTVDGFPANEIVLTLQDGSTHHCLIVVAKSRIYIATAGGPLVSSEGNERVRKFLDSFHITDDKGNPWRGKEAPKNKD
jgi:predicted Zn finger-like uncharacterized protein